LRRRNNVSPRRTQGQEYIKVTHALQVFPAERHAPKRAEPLRVSLAVELIKAGQVEDAKRVLKVAIQQDPQLRAVILDHPGLGEIW
jgi:Tfp pilus assembly protein PilF